ncbi:MAG: ATP-dependent Clp protease ATP-binding subunit [Gemmatimonadales bacterium]|nr:ATP-dependent Clp protease ATP-binding subunit [Gemmatimonadales bacterium]
MGLKLDPESEAARDLAKRAVPAGGELDVGILLSALYHSSALKDQFPQLAPCLKKPAKRHKDAPDKVQLAEALRPVMTHLAALNDRPLSPVVWFRALLESEPGRAFVTSAGVTESDLQAVLSALPAVAAAPEPAPSGWRESSERREVIEALGTFGRTLTATDPPQKGVVQMERPLKSLLRALAKRKQRSAIVIGAPGTGKSALVYELARRLITGDGSIPARLRDYDIFELSPTFLRSGASYVGQYDERVSSLIKLLRAHPKVILFVDEVHSLLQSGMHARGPFTDANEAFKQALAMGELSMIGCTTTAEYRHYIEPDQAMAQRFTVVRIEAPSPEETLRILVARRPTVQDFYDLPISDDILERTVELTEEYLLGRAQPRKSIQLLDEACAFAVMQDPPADDVTEAELWQALEGTIGHSIARTAQLTEEQLFEELGAKIIGQDQALRGIARAFVSGLGGWAAKRNAPRGVFFFAGPTGVGKTETALLLSKVLGSGRESLVRVDCNTLQGSGHDSHPAVNILLGPPPGYVGYVRGEGGKLSTIRDHPESIVLFDEIEKADPGVGKLLLQIIDDGRCEDTDGNTLDFRRSFIIFTTNAGCVYDEKRLGFHTAAGPIRPRTDMEALRGEIRAMGLGEEFLGRIGHYFEFNGLEGDSIRQILGAQLDRLRETAEVRGYDLEWQDEIVEHLTSQWQPRFGVRHLVAILRNRIVEQLSVAEAQGELKGIKTIRLEVLETDGADDKQDLAGLAARERRKETLVIKVA